MNLGSRLADVARNAGRSVHNARAAVLPKRPHFVELELEGRFPERTVPLSLLQRAARAVRHGMSIEELSRRMDAIGDDPRIDGALLRFSELHLTTAKAQTLAGLVSRLRARGKRVVAWLDHIDAHAYTVAAAADEILAPEGADFDVRGLAIEVSFLKDLLARMGLSFDVEAIGEYKTAADSLARNRMSDAHREMLDAILDSLYADLVTAIAEGRGIAPEAARHAIDEAPIPAQRAVEAELIDAVVFEDEIPRRLARGSDEPARVQPWDRAASRLRHPYRWRDHRAIGVISLKGTIVTGRSRTLPVSVPLLGLQSGSSTLAQCLRAAEKDDQIAAVVLYVDSPGGSALASDLIWREVQRLRRKKPVVAYMGSVAASGGYYVAAAASAIVAQPGTLTGSIGVITGKGVMGGLYDKLGVRRERLVRGRMATLYSSDRAFDDAERARVKEAISVAYERFKSRVAEGRALTLDEVERLARGRVYSGRQALELRLVDSLGDLRSAVDKARELAGLPPAREVRTVTVSPPRVPLAPPVDKGVASLLVDLREGAHDLLREPALALSPLLIHVLA